MCKTDQIEVPTGLWVGLFVCFVVAFSLGFWFSLVFWGKFVAVAAGGWGGSMKCDQWFPLTLVERYER